MNAWICVQHARQQDLLGEVWGGALAGRFANYQVSSCRARLQLPESGHSINCLRHTRTT